MKIKKSFAGSGQFQLSETISSLLNPMLGILTAILYLLMTGSQLGGADSGELIGASYNLGIAHPPGYPLYIVAGKIFSLISPFDNILYTYNLFSTLTFLLALFILYRSLRLLNMHPLAIFLASSVYIFSPLNLRWLTVAEVFSLHILLLATGIYIICHIIAQERLTKISRLLGLVAGLGACNHHSLVFFLPGYLGVYCYYWLRLADNKTRMMELAWLGAFFLAGLLFYLQPVIVSAIQEQPVSSLGMLVDSPKAFIDLFLRRMYGTLSMGASAGKSSLFYWPWNYLQQMASGAGAVIVSGCVLYFIALIGKFRSPIFPAILLWIAGSLAFLLLIRITPSPTVPVEIISRMYFTPDLAMHIAAVLGFDYLFRKTDIDRRNILFMATSSILLPAVLWIALNNGLSANRKQPVDISMQYGRDILDSCPPKSMIILNTDISSFSVFYLQEVEGYRKDVLAVVWPMIKREEYRLLTLRRINDRFRPAKELRPQSIWQKTNFTTLELITSLLEDGVPIHTLYQDIESHFPDQEYDKEALTLAPSGISNKLSLETEDEESIGRENIPAIRAYISWLTRISSSGNTLPQWQEAVIEHYLAYLKMMRRLLFSHPEILPPDNLFGVLCLFLREADREDPYGDFYLGFYYYFFTRNFAEAQHSLELFIEQSRLQTRYKKDVETAGRLLNRIRTATLDGKADQSINQD